MKKQSVGNPDRFEMKGKEVFPEMAMTLIGTFQGAILELSAKLDAEKDSMSPVDVENTKFVVGMASVNAFNLEQVVKQGVAYCEANKAKVNRLFAEATKFAAALRAEGYGLVL